ncbi:MAG: hypothetical protein ACUVST_02255 [Anaerolineae bacterium]
MLQRSEEFVSGEARLRVDVHGSRPVEHLLEDTTFLNYRLASVEIAPQVTRPEPDMVWYQDAARKGIRYEGGVLVLEGEWYEGEVQKIVVSMLALKMEAVGLHPFHASAIRYRDRTILFLGGESNHGKTMSQIEGCRRGGLVISTETTVCDERGWAVRGSKNVFLRKRAKGTERSDLPSQDEGVAKFFDRTPEFIPYDEPSDVDLVIVPSIDGNFDTRVVEMIPFEREYQTYHSLMNYFGLNQLLSPGLPMPIIDTDELRLRRADFCHRFAQRPYYLIRAKNPQLLLDEVERLL